MQMHDWFITYVCIMHKYTCIYICVVVCMYVYRSNTTLTSKTGAFAACGTVVGVVATLLQRFPDYTPYQIREQLIRESTKNAINFHTRNGQNLSSIIVETTPNRLAYTGKGRCINSKAVMYYYLFIHVNHP